MKKAKLFPAILVLICFLLLLSSCAGRKSLSFDKVYNTKTFVYEDTSPSFTNAEKLSFDGYDAKKVVNNMLLFQKDRSYRVYNATTGKTLYEYDADFDESVFIKGHNYADRFFVFWVQIQKPEAASEGIGHSTVLYDHNGSEIAKADSEIIPVFSADLIYFDGICYRVHEDGTVENAFAYSTLAEYPQPHTATKKYYYSGNNKTGFRVFDKELNLVSSYAYPSYVKYSNSNTVFPHTAILNNGNVLIQYALAEPDSAKQYDYIDEDGAKYSLISKIFNVENGTEKEVDLNYVLVGGSSRAEGFFEPDSNFEKKYHKSIDNVVLAYEIKDGRVDRQVVSFSVNNNGKIKAVLSETFPEESAGMYLQPVAPNRYTNSTRLDEKMLLDEKGNIIASVDKATVYEGYIYGDGKIFDFDMKVICDIKEKDLELVATLNRCAVLQSDDAYHLMVNGEVSHFMDRSDAISIQALGWRDGFVIVDHSQETPHYTYYNDLGEKFFSSDKKLTLFCSANGSAIFVEEGTNNYYRFY